MTYADSAVRLRDLPKMNMLGKVNALGAFMTFTVLGLSLPDVLEYVASGGDPLAAVVYTGGLLALGLACLYIVDDELREVNA